MYMRRTRMITSFIAVMVSSVAAHAGEFHIQEASIDSIQNAIKSGDATCKQIVESYIARAKAYNGACSKLVTADGASVKSYLGPTRAGVPLKFPTDTLSIKQMLPDFDKYKGATPDFG